MVLLLVPWGVNEVVVAARRLLKKDILMGISYWALVGVEGEEVVPLDFQIY
jgi:hypothetical protein